MSRQLQSNNRSSKSGNQKGFTLIEVLVSIAVLAIGLLSVAALVASTIQSGARARYMSMASVLASEKLDSLNKWPSADVLGGTTTLMSTLPTDPNIWPGGSLTPPTECAAGDYYCDQVTVSESSGADYETQTQMVSGNPVTTTIVHTNSGCVGTPAACGVATPAGSGSTFTRRWLITGNPSISAAGGGATTAFGVRRITVLVTLNNSTLNQPVSFQMSMVRP